jgi:hypothetical protein
MLEFGEQPIILDIGAEFDRRRRAGLAWAKETERAKDFVLPEFRDLTPNFMNYIDGPPLVEAFERAGFITEQAWYYTRHGLPEVFKNDGREHFGHIGRIETTGGE